MSSGVLLESAEQDENLLAVDLQVASTRELQEAADLISKRLEQRSAGNANYELLAKQLAHIDEQLQGAGTIPDSLDEAVPLSLEHLELYEGFLERVDPPKDLTELHNSLLDQVRDLIKNHPMAGIARSRDRAGMDPRGTAYFKVPRARRLQTAVMLYCNLLTGPTLVVLVIVLFWLLVPFSTLFFIAYATYSLYDNRRLVLPDRSRISQSLRRSRFYRLFRNYFPIRVMKAAKSTPFDPARNFLFCYHPHGVQSAGAFSFATNASGIDQLLPGLSISVQTLAVNYKIPIIKENFLMLGMGDASSGCLNRALTAGPGASAMLVTGGALESMFSHPYTSKVVLKTRRGFVRVAMEAGADLVPVWGFGENNLYENLAVGSPSVLRWQRRIQRVLSFAPILVAGRGVFTYSGGLLPHRRPISVVIGKPIPVGPATPNPSEEAKAEVHKKYQEAVKELFETYKDIYDPKAKPIEFV